jgi:molecular chaperone GrpE
MSKDMEKEIMTDKNSVEEKESSQDEKESTQDQDHRKEKKRGKPKAVQKHVEKETTKLNKEIAELKEKYLRLYSEYENYRRRTAKEKIDLISTANEDLMSDLLPVIDDFERALKAMDENNKECDSIKEGISFIFNKLKNVTDKKGLKLIESKPGDSFNTEIHDAISQIPAPEEKLKGKIVDTVEKGYYLNDKVIRFAKVVIGA